MSSFNSVTTNNIPIVKDVHICKQSTDLEIQIQILTKKLNRCEVQCKQKAYEVNKLSTLVNYYQKRAKTLKDIISNLKSQELISDHTEQVLNVR